MCSFYRTMHLQRGVTFEEMRGVGQKYRIAASIFPQGI